MMLALTLSRYWCFSKCQGCTDLMNCSVFPLFVTHLDTAGTDSVFSATAMCDIMLPIELQQLVN